MEGTEERFIEFKERNIAMIQFEQQRENRLKRKIIKISRASGTFITVTNDLAFMTLESLKKRK